MRFFAMVITSFAGQSVFLPQRGSSGGAGIVGLAPWGKPLSNPRVVALGAFQGPPNGGSQQGGPGTRPGQGTGLQRGCRACDAEREGHPAARPPLPSGDYPGVVPLGTFGVRCAASLSRRRITGDRPEIVKSGAVPGAGAGEGGS